MVRWRDGEAAEQAPEADKRARPDSARLQLMRGVQPASERELQRVERNVIKSTRDEFEEKLLATGMPVEARAWLEISDGTSRTLGELTSTDDSRELIESLYRVGATEVFAVKVQRYVRESLHEDEASENTGHLVIRLPSDAVRRSKVFELQAREARRLGFDPTPDTGQGLLYLGLD